MACSRVFAYTLIVCKVLGVIAISLPKIPGKVREWAYAGLTFNLIFAFISHAAGERNAIIVKLKAAVPDQDTIDEDQQLIEVTDAFDVRWILYV